MGCCGWLGILNAPNKFCIPGMSPANGFMGATGGGGGTGLPGTC